MRLISFLGLVCTALLFFSTCQSSYSGPSGPVSKTTTTNHQKFVLKYLKYTSSGARAMRGFGAMCLLVNLRRYLLRIILPRFKARSSEEFTYPQKSVVHYKALKLSCDKSSPRVSHCWPVCIEAGSLSNDPNPVSAASFLFPSEFRKAPNLHHDFHHFTSV